MIYGLDLAFCFCNLLARVYKVRPLCSQNSAFGHESTEYVVAQKKVASDKLPQCPISQLEIPATDGQVKIYSTFKAMPWRD
jgi:hypothetical protein